MIGASTGLLHPSRSWAVMFSGISGGSMSAHSSCCKSFITGLPDGHTLLTQCTQWPDSCAHSDGPTGQAYWRQDALKRLLVTGEQFAVEISSFGEHKQAGPVDTMEAFELGAAWPCGNEVPTYLQVAILSCHTACQLQGFCFARTAFRPSKLKPLHHCQMPLMRSCLYTPACARLQDEPTSLRQAFMKCLQLLSSFLLRWVFCCMHAA